MENVKSITTISDQHLRALKEQYLQSSSLKEADSILQEIQELEKT